MTFNEQNGAQNVSADGTTEDQEHESPRPRPPVPEDADSLNAEPPAVPRPDETAHADVEKKPDLDKQKLIVLGASLLIAILFFILVSLFSHHRGPTNNATKRTSVQQAQPKSAYLQGSVTPLMDVTPRNAGEDNDGVVKPSDIERTGTPSNRASNPKQSLPPEAAQGNAAKANTLGAIPSFADTQQRWEEPPPYAAQGQAPSLQSQQALNVLKEPSLVFVRSISSSQGSSTALLSSSHNGPLLQIEPGTRIEAKLETQISTAVSDPVIAVVEYTYAIGDHIVIPAGSIAIGQLRQADRFGNMDVKFTELDLSEDNKEAIDASGRALDMGPIKGTVTGKNTGKNFLIRAGSGLGSVAAMMVGNNTSSAFSEDDLLRERVAENIGEAGDSELMNLNANSKIVVSAPADTKIYIVFSRTEDHSQSLHKIPSNAQ